MTTTVWKKSLLGKVFISHSFKDKPFVRRLAKRLWQDGYAVWLDEKELVPGDALAQRLSDALAQSKVVIVVVTQHSVNSRWLKFELNKAIERMVQGQCRVIPALKGAVEVPAELKSVIYADFRRSFAEGIRGVLQALDHESQVALQRSWAELRVMLGEVFDNQGTASVFGEYDSFDFDYVQIDGLIDPHHLPAGEPADIMYDLVHVYSSDSRPLTDKWWNEYLNTRDRFPSSFHLIVSERPVAILEPIATNPRLRVWARTDYWDHHTSVVIADISGLANSSDKRQVLEAARDELVFLGKERGLFREEGEPKCGSTPRSRS